MSRVTKEVTPIALEEVKRQFDDWRRSRAKLERIPSKLLQLAVVAARHHGVHRASTVLRVEFNRLKREVAGVPRSALRDQRPAAGFVEVRVPAPVPSPECLVELERPDGGRMRVRGLAPEHLAALSRSFWGCQS